MRDETSDFLEIVSKAFLCGLYALLLMAVVGLALGWLLLLVWNASMPHIFGLPEIGFWQAFALYMTASLLVRRSPEPAKKDRKATGG